MKDETKLIIPSDPARLEEVDAFAERWMDGMPFSEDQRYDIAISLSEAVNNAIEHGNAGDASKKVTIILTPIDGGIHIKVSDEGGGFNPESVADPTEPANLLSESGRGLLIISHLMDEVKVEPCKAGTCIELVKRFSSSKAS
ncbi:ATP-binding protein [bacterium]|nr:ATP-binding protein [bacterium]